MQRIRFDGEKPPGGIPAPFQFHAVPRPLDPGAPESGRPNVGPDGTSRLAERLSIRFAGPDHGLFHVMKDIHVGTPADRLGGVERDATRHVTFRRTVSRQQSQHLGLEGS